MFSSVVRRPLLGPRRAQRKCVFTSGADDSGIERRGRVSPRRPSRGRASSGGRHGTRSMYKELVAYWRSVRVSRPVTSSALLARNGLRSFGWTRTH